MAGSFHAVPVIKDWQCFDQRLCEIESQWEIFPAKGGINSAEKWNCLESLAMLVKGCLVPLSNSTFEHGQNESAYRQVDHLSLWRCSVPFQLLRSLAQKYRYLSRENPNIQQT